MKKLKQILALALSLLIAITFLQLTVKVKTYAAEVIDSGSCGDHVIWALDDAGVLTISGQGRVKDFDFDAPWEPYNSQITKLVIKDGVEGIGKYAFSGCKKLSAIQVPKSLKYVGEGAFYGTKWLKSQPSGIVYIRSVLYEFKGKCPSVIKVKKGTTMIAGHAFSSKRTLRKVSIPKTVTYIGPAAFEACDLRTVNLSNGIKTIAEFAFSCNLHLQKITIPKSVKEIGTGAFDSCNLSKVTIKNKKVHLGAAVFRANPITISQKGAKYVSGVLTDFYDNAGTANVKIKEGTKSIAAATFEAADITGVTIPKSVKTIEANMLFYDCSKLKTIKVAKGNKVFDSRKKCNAIIKTKTHTLIAGCKTTVIPKSVKKIGPGAFEACNRLKQISIPKSVTTIDDYAFFNCTKLKKITIPKTVTIIGEKAFGYKMSPSGAKKIKGFTIYGSTGSAAEAYANECGFQFVRVN